MGRNRRRTPRRKKQAPAAATSETPASTTASPHPGEAREESVPEERPELSAEEDGPRETQDPPAEERPAPVSELAPGTKAPPAKFSGIEQEVRQALDERLKLEGELEVLRRQAAEERARADELLGERDRLRVDFGRELEDRDRRVVSLQEELGEVLLENQELRARTDKLAVSAEERLRRLATGLESLALLAHERREQVEALRNELGGEPQPLAPGLLPLPSTPARQPSGSQVSAADLARASIAAQQAATTRSGAHKTASREELRARASARREAQGLPPIDPDGALASGESAAAERESDKAASSAQPSSVTKVPATSQAAAAGTEEASSVAAAPALETAPASKSASPKSETSVPEEGASGVLVRDPASRASPAVEAASRASQRLGSVDPKEAAAAVSPPPLPANAAPAAKEPAAEASAVKGAALVTTAMTPTSPAPDPEKPRPSGSGSRTSVRARRLDADWEQAEKRRKFRKALAVTAAYAGGVLLVVMLGSSVWRQMMPWGKRDELKRSAPGSSARGSRGEAARGNRSRVPPRASSARPPSRPSSRASQQPPAKPAPAPAAATASPSPSRSRTEQPAVVSPPEVGEPDETTAAIEAALTKVRAADSQGSIRTATRQLVALVRPQDLGLLCDVISKVDDENVRRSVVKAMGKIASKDVAALEAVSEVVRADAAASVRIEGIHVLRNLRYLDSVSLLEDLIATERDGAIRIAALGAMRSFGHKQHGPAVVQGFQNEATVAGRVALIKALGDIGGADELAFLEQVSEDPIQDAPIRASASAAMGRVRRRLDYQGRADSGGRR